MSVRGRVLLALLLALGAIVLTLGFAAALGSPLWQADSVSLCVAAYDQQDPQIASDGSGGAIVTWSDYRSDGDIYAQRVDGNGNALWVADGVSLCVSTGNQYYPQIVCDGSGGAIVTWEDYRDAGTTGADIYAQRVDGVGNALWQADGVSLCVASYNQEDPQIVSDGSGGAIVTWHDYRSGNDDIYARRVGQDGNALWDTNGVSLCVATGSQYKPQIVSDGSGGAIVTWQDQRDWGTTGDDIYAQRVDDNGNALWDTDGVSLCAAIDQQEYPQIVSDGSGGAIVTWQDKRSVTTYDIYAQRVGADGSVEWTDDGVSLCVASNGQSEPQIASDGSGGAIVTWKDARSGTSYDIYAQRVDGNGNALWVADGVSLCVVTQFQGYPQIAPDGSGGAIVTWQDQRGSDDDIYAQRVDGNGTTLWQADGVSLCVATDYQEYPQIAPDGYWGAIVTWQDKRSGTNYDIYAQRVSGVAEVSLPLVMRKYP